MSDGTYKLSEEVVLSAIDQITETDPPVTTTDIMESIDVDCHRNTLLKRLNALEDAGKIESDTVRARTKIWKRA